ncbi:MAG: hypothetical protein IKE52_02615 [Mogibacterium sp.]|nr:hypothetical protein [Mogibacterium sp.]
MSAYINCFISGQGKGDWLAAKKALAELEGMVVKGGECVDNTYLAKILKNMISLHEENDVFDKMGGLRASFPMGHAFSLLTFMLSDAMASENMNEPRAYRRLLRPCADLNFPYLQSI